MIAAHDAAGDQTVSAPTLQNPVRLRERLFCSRWQAFSIHFAARAARQNPDQTDSAGCLRKKNPVRPWKSFLRLREGHHFIKTVFSHGVI